MTTQRNEPCPCGSGKKYKRCCLLDEGPLRVLPPSADTDWGMEKDGGPALPPVLGRNAGSLKVRALIRRHPDLAHREAEILGALRDAYVSCGSEAPFGDDVEEHHKYLEELLCEAQFESIQIGCKEMRTAMLAAGFNPEHPRTGSLDKLSARLCTKAHREQRASLLLGSLSELADEGRPEDVLIVAMHAEEMLTSKVAPTLLEFVLFENAIGFVMFERQLEACAARVADRFSAEDRARILENGFETWIEDAVKSPARVHLLFDAFMGHPEADPAKIVMMDCTMPLWISLLQRPEASCLFPNDAGNKPYVAELIRGSMVDWNLHGMEGQLPSAEETVENLGRGLHEFALRMVSSIDCAEFARTTSLALTALRKQFLQQDDDEAAAWAEAMLLVFDVGHVSDEDLLPFVEFLCRQSLRDALASVTSDPHRFAEIIDHQEKLAEMEEANHPRTELSLNEDISDEAWSRLYRAALQVHEMAPWEWMNEHQLFGVRIAPTGRIGFVSVMGAAGDYLAISIYDGEQGGNHYRSVSGGNDDEEMIECLRCIKQLHACFGGKKDLEKVEVQLMKRLGIKTTRRMATPYFRSWRPGFVPWGIDADECRLLTHALEQLVVVAPRLKDDANALEGEDSYTWMVRTISDEEIEGKVRESWERFPPERVVLKPTLDMNLVQQVKQLPASSAAIEMDVSIMASVIDDGLGRPRVPFGLFLVDADSAHVHGAQPMEVTTTLEDLRATVPNELMQMLITVGARPRAIALKTDWLKQVLSNLLPLLSIEMLEAEELPALEELRAALLDHFA